MNYDLAVKLWGASRLNQRYEGYREGTFIPDTVTVTFDFNEGYGCCGGSDPECYCSLAESARAEVNIQGKSSDGNYGYSTISFEDFDLATVLREIFEASED